MDAYCSFQITSSRHFFGPATPLLCATCSFNSKVILALYKTFGKQVNFKKCLRGVSDTEIRSRFKAMSSFKKALFILGNELWEDKFESLLDIVKE